MLLTIISCESDKNGVEINPKSVSDCEGLSTNPQSKGICLDRAKYVLTNDIITYASKSTSNYSDISWFIESGSIEILDIENSTRVDGFNKSIATIKFYCDFSGGSLKVKTINNSGESAEFGGYPIKLEN